MNIENDLNIPPDAEPVGKKISRIATQFAIPVILPASSAFFAWLVQRRTSAKLAQLEQESSKVANLKDTVTKLKDEVKFLETHRGALATGHLKELLQRILPGERHDFNIIMTDLDNMEGLLKERQKIKCSLFTHHSHRLRIEDNKLKPFSYSRPYDKELGLYKGVLDILERDNYCDLQGSQHGHLMWVYMDLWKARAEMRMHRRVLKRIHDVALKDDKNQPSFNLPV